MVLSNGNGMLHSIIISQGKATLCSRYVKTYKYNIENEARYPLIPNGFSGFNSLVASTTCGSLTAARVLMGQYNPINGVGLANTSLALIGNRLFALGESNLPYIVELTSNGDIETMGRHDFDGKLAISMTAHPKIDPETGEAFAFCYGPVPPFHIYFRFDLNGNTQPDVPTFSMTRPSFIHDFAITKKYANFADIHIGINPIEMIASGSPVGIDPLKVPRIGVLPRYATDESQIKWFNVPGFNIIHAINTWDEDDGNSIVMVAPNILSIKHTLEKVRVNLRTETVTRQPISARNLDFAVINVAFIGKKNKFIYSSIDDLMPNISGVIKLDVSKANERKKKKVPFDMMEMMLRESKCDCFPSLKSVW